jgi:Sua5/YciO/YrdC/YwlC family protein
MLKLYSNSNSLQDLQKVVDILNDGGIIIYPTDTMYALGCHAMKERAIEKICRIKEVDPRKHYLSIVCASLSMVADYAKLGNNNFKLLKKNLPGSFTFILPASSRLPKIFKNRKEVGIRMPDNSIVSEISNLLNAPMMVATLPYNLVDDIEYVTNPELIDEKFGAEVNLIIDGGIGGEEPSTIVDCTGDEPEIVRHGKGELEY